MYRDVEYRWIIVKDLGSAITNMNIPVKNHNFLRTILLLCDSSSNSNIIEETESGHDVSVGVMTRWAHNGESLVNHNLRANARDNFNRATSRDKSGLLRVPIHISINLHSSQVLLRFESLSILSHVLDMQWFVCKH